MQAMADQADVDRFMSFVDILPNGCWFWTGARSRGGGNRKWYGSFWINGRAVRAHRFSCDEIGKMPPLPRGWHRDHTCCFSLCVNWEHLEYVTHAINQDRKIARSAHHNRERKNGSTQGNIYESGLCEGLR
jgi:hypothetical protein